MKLYRNLLIFGGLLHIGVGVFHMFFWQLFQWEKELALLTYDNSIIMQILNICLIYVFFVVAYFFLVHVDELIETKLGKSILVSVAMFWLVRMIVGTIFCGISDLFNLFCLLAITVYILPLRFRA